MADFVTSILDYLANQDTVAVFGQGLVGGVTLFAHVQPDTATDCVLVTPYSTKAPDAVRDAHYPAVQLRISHESAAAAHDLGLKLLRLLHKNSTVVSGALCLAKNSLPLNMGKDDRGRSMFSINFSFLAAGKVGTP